MCYYAACWPCSHSTEGPTSWPLGGTCRRRALRAQRPGQHAERGWAQCPAVAGQAAAVRTPRCRAAPGSHCLMHAPCKLRLSSHALAAVHTTTVESYHAPPQVVHGESISRIQAQSCTAFHCCRHLLAWRTHDGLQQGRSNVPPKPEDCVGPVLPQEDAVVLQLCSGQPKAWLRHCTTTTP